VMRCSNEVVEGDFRCAGGYGEVPGGDRDLMLIIFLSEE